MELSISNPTLDGNDKVSADDARQACCEGLPAASDLGEGAMSLALNLYRSAFAAS
jgi:hypothetical protein